MQRSRPPSRRPPRAAAVLRAWALLYPATVEAIGLNPRLRVLVAGGLYDSFLPCAIGEELQQRLTEKLKASLTFRCYVGGHAIYLDAPARRELARDAAELMAARR